MKELKAYMRITTVWTAEYKPIYGKKPLCLISPSKTLKQNESELTTQSVIVLLCQIKQMIVTNWQWGTDPFVHCIRSIQLLSEPKQKIGGRVGGYFYVLDGFNFV